MHIKIDRSVLHFHKINVILIVFLDSLPSQVFSLKFDGDMGTEKYFTIIK